MVIANRSVPGLHERVVSRVKGYKNVKCDKELQAKQE